MVVDVVVVAAATAAAVVAIVVYVAVGAPAAVDLAVASVPQKQHMSPSRSKSTRIIMSFLLSHKKLIGKTSKQSEWTFNRYFKVAITERQTDRHTHRL